MKMEDVWKYYNCSWADFVKECDVSWGSVRNWRIKGIIPYKFQQRFEKITKGALKAEIEHSEKPYKKIKQLTGVDVERAKREINKHNKD